MKATETKTEKRRETKMAKKANVANGGGKWITTTRRHRIYERDGHSCVYCGHSIYDDANLILTIDHVVSQDLGGTNRSENLVTACKRCNSIKGSKTVRAFFQYLRDNGTETDKIGPRVRRQTRKSKSWKF